LPINYLKRNLLSGDDKKFVASLKNLLGFYPENLSLYKLAFFHKSVAPEVKAGIKASNERLEFLGDAILDAIVAEYLFKKYPFEDEGFLTELRSKIVSRKNLNHLAQKMGLDKFIKSDNRGNMRSNSIMGDALEAMIGAIYLDKGFIKTKKFVLVQLINNHIDVDELQEQELNFKSRLIEWIQKERKSLRFEVVTETDMGARKLFVINAVVNDEVLGTGQDFSKKRAEQSAAEKALEKIELTNNG
jgi:ribonuclease-3